MGPELFPHVEILPELNKDKEAVIISNLFWNSAGSPIFEILLPILKKLTSLDNPAQSLVPHSLAV